jgi:predicted alpha/beta-fold hydrolase
MAAALNAAGWDVLAWNFRGCGGEANRLQRFYHSGDTGDLAAVIERASAAYERIALIGFSLGGNVTLKYLGEGWTHPAVVAGVGVSVPVDLAASCQVLDHQWENRIYLRRLLKLLIAKVQAKARQFSELDVTGAQDIRTFAEFDGRYTAPLHRFHDARDYWARSSARAFLPRITLPTLFSSVRNDPLLAPECFPQEEAEANPSLFLEVPESDGYVGFIDLVHSLQPWSERRVVEFLTALPSKVQTLTS